MNPSTEQVKRYDNVEMWGMDLTPNGRYVLYSDHVSAISEKEKEHENDLAFWKSRVQGLVNKWAEARVQIEKSELAKEAAESSLSECRKALDKYRLLLLNIAARFARREYAMNIEGCRTIADARREHDRHDTNHANVAFNLKKELDEIRATEISLAPTTKEGQ